MALGLAVTLVERLANGARDREARDRHRLASPGISRVLDVEKSSMHRPIARRRGCPRSDSEDGAGESALGRATNSRRATEIGTGSVSGDGREIHARRPTAPSQTWRTFLANHVQQIAAADFFVVPTATCRLLFVLVLLAHERRRVVHVAVTAHPTAAWTAQQLREAFPWDESPRYLVHDRDTAFEGLATATAIGIDGVITAAHSPWQNAYAERLIESNRRECLDHIIVANERGLRRVLHAYVDYYLKSRTHLALGKDAPVSRPVAPPGNGAIVALPHLSGLHHRYERRAA